MTPPMAAWRVTYTPGEWLVLSGPTMLVVMLPAPARMSGLVNTLWDDILGARSVDALLEVFGRYGIDGMPDFAAFFWDATGLHGMARGQLCVLDADTGNTVVSGSDVVTWREEPLGTARHLRVGMQQVDEDEYLQLPLVVGAVMASAIHLSTDPESRVQFPEGGREGILKMGAVPTQPPEAPAVAEIADEAPASALPEDDDRPAEVVGLGDESEMEPFSEPSATPEDEDNEFGPEPHFDDDFPLWSRPDAEEDADSDGDGVGGFRFDADENDHPSPAAVVPPAPQAEVGPPIPPPASASVVVPRTFQVGDDDDDGGTVFSSNLAATHKPAAEPEEQRKVLAAPCARGHANAPGSRGCRVCSAPVDSSHPRLINRPALAGVHSNRGEFADIHVAVIVGRSPDASKGPRGAHLMRVPSPSSDISRSHLIVTPRDWSVIVTDLDSTNGTTVLPVGEQSFVLGSGESVQVDLGTVLDLGDGVSLRIEPPRG